MTTEQALDELIDTGRSSREGGEALFDACLIIYTPDGWKPTAKGKDAMKRRREERGL